MEIKNITPALANLNQDIAGPIPIELVKHWLHSGRTDADHERILEPYKRVGTIVSSDAAGLSKLSAGRPLIEVMKLVCQPKEIIYARGTAIGGKTIGIWAADNTQMFYDQSIDPNDVVLQMISAQRDIENVTVNVGIGIHSGTAYEISGGLYGVATEMIEEFTENESEGGEVIISPRIHAKLKDSLNRIALTRGSMYVLDYANCPFSEKRSYDVFYPAPFDRAFHVALRHLDLNDQDQIAALHRERVIETSIVLFRSFDQAQSRLLDSFTLNVAANAVIHDVCRKFEGQMVKSTGTLAIISCEKEEEGVELAVALMQAAKENGMVANVGISRGETLLFDLGGGVSDLAGGPVNIASKLAEDTNERGKMFFEGVVAEHAKRHGFTNAFDIMKSGVSIRGVMA